jgi:hypothetical protein
LTRGLIGKILPLLAVSLLATWSVAYTQSSNSDITVRESVQTAPAGSAITSDITDAQVPSCDGSSTTPKIEDYAARNLDKGASLRSYVTPEDQTIEALAAHINGPGEAYQMAVQWIYVSERKLNHAADKWLTPYEFLANTPHYLSNPFQGEEVSDCEEQANTLASLIRAEGIRPEEVRIALGEVTFDDLETGHAWVELLTNGQWLALDPSWGPYWDDKAEKLVRRRGISFDYYASHTYPVLQVWAYYNDTYYLNPGDGSGNAPASWHCETDFAPLRQFCQAGLKI